jgi:hypothetical protein
MGDISGISCRLPSDDLRDPTTPDPGPLGVPDLEQLATGERSAVKAPVSSSDL